LDFENESLMLGWYKPKAICFSLRRHFFLLAFLTLVSVSYSLFQPISVNAQLLCAADTTSTKPISGQDGSKFIDSAIQVVRAFNDYVFDSEVLTYKKSDPQVSSGRFFWKRPKLLRVEVTGSSYRAGSAICRTPEGTVRAKGGSCLAFVKMTIDEHSRLLQLSNGLNVLQSDLLSMLSNAKSKLASGRSCRLSSSTVRLAGIPGDFHVLDIIAGIGNNEVLEERVYFNNSDNLPALLEIYRDGKLWSKVKILNLKVNQGLQDDLFKF
jgi:outer membrane lipoprotein-sorting protein